MRIPPLILCDGLPGSGKTTTTQQLWLHAEALGYEARWWFEHDSDHPILAFERAREAQQQGGDTARRTFAGSLAGWEGLARQLDSARVTLLEGTLFQVTVGAQLLADLPEAEIEAHFDRTMELISQLEPALIHLRPKDVAKAFEATCARRGSWFPDYVQREFAASVRGRRLGRSDLPALVEYFSRRRDLSDALFDRFPGRKLLHDNSDGDWAKQRRAITEFLGIPAIPSMPVPDKPEEFTGRYRAETDDEWTIVADQAGLRLDGENATRLLPHGRDRFVLEGVSVEVHFRRRTDGAISELECVANLPSLPRRWKKL